MGTAGGGGATVVLQSDGDLGCRTLHDLRHTAACEWILQGVPLTTVQAWLGHSSIEITARYLHRLGDYADRTALQLLNAKTATTQSAQKPPRQRPNTRRLAPISAFGQGPASASGPGHSLSR
jgi:hypothetical protein